MSPIRSAATLPGSNGWILALDFDKDSHHWSPDADKPLLNGRYEVVLNRVDCEGCAAAVEGALQTIRGVSRAGCTPGSSKLVFDVVGQLVHMSDIEEELEAVSRALKKMISIASLRGPLPTLFSAA